MRKLLPCILIMMSACGGEIDESDALDSEESEVGSELTASRQNLVVMNSTATVQHYWRYVPEDYATSGSKSYPLLIFLHGIGERGARNSAGSCLASADRVKRHGPPKMINLDTWKRTEFIVVSPQNCNTGWWSADEVESVVRHAIAKNRVDESRIYVTGLSAGGAGTLKYVNAHPERVAAAFTAAAANQSKSDYCQGLTQVPVWLFHNKWDRLVTYNSQAVSMKNGIEACASTPPEAPTLTTYETPTEDQCLCASYPCSKCHDAWTRTYNTNHAYDWLLAHRKAARTVSHSVTINSGSTTEFTAGDGKVFVPTSFSRGAASTPITSRPRSAAPSTTRCSPASASASRPITFPSRRAATS